VYNSIAVLRDIAPEKYSVNTPEPQRVLILIPAYNSASYIEDTLRSLQNQAHSLWVAVVVDDGSTDRTADIVETFARGDSRVQLVRLSENSGRPAVPRNKGLDYAIRSGIQFDFVSFLDADDYWLPDKLKIDLEFLRQHPDLELLCNNGVLILKNGSITRKRLRRIRGIARFHFFHHIYCSTVIIRKSVALKYQPLFDEDPNLKAMEDSELWYRLLADKVPCDAVESFQTVYRINEASISRVDYGLWIRRLTYLYAKASAKNKLIPWPLFFLGASFNVGRLAVRQLISLFQRGKSAS
jgi:teichuronic acid biosynthesis glycosyltransferase TuaG